MTKLTFNEAQDLLKNSTILYNKHEIEIAISNIINKIETDMGEEIPLFLTIMNGGMFFATLLLQQIKKPLICDYVHASRYGNENFGSTHIAWYRQPNAEDVFGRNVYIIDDILDEGHTLFEVNRFIMGLGAKSCKQIVMIDKEINKSKPISAQFVALSAPNKFLFGYGMDIFGIYRNIPNIYIYNQ